MQPSSRLIILVIIFMLAASGCREEDSGQADTPGEEAGTTTTYSVEEMVELGQEHFSVYCVACHGPNAKGITGLGVNLVESDFVGDLTEEELVTFVINGRPTDSPNNRTGIAMPARGGFPKLSDEQIAHIIAYLKSINVSGGDS